MLATITVRWALIYFCIGWASAPFLLQAPVTLSNVIVAGIALVLIYTAPKQPKDKQ